MPNEQMAPPVVRAARLWWLTFRTADKMSGVMVVDAPSLSHARLIASMRVTDALADIGEGHALDAAMAARVPAADLGRMLSPGEAERLLTRLGGVG
jgi:hypothetical protein